MKILAGLNIAFCLFELCSSYNPSTKKGHVLFYFPVMPQSAKITFMPVAEELAARGHEVYVTIILKTFSQQSEYISTYCFRLLLSIHTKVSLSQRKILEKYTLSVEI